MLSAATLLLAAGAAVTAALFVAPVRDRRRMAMLLALSVAAMGVGAALLAA